MPASIEKLLNSQYVQLALAALAFLIALWFVVVIARMLMGGRMRLPGGRTRQARLGIVDAFDLDRQRQLIIVRRDNTEHLIMIGGPNDLLIESEIVRVESRDGRRDKTGDAEARMDGRSVPRIGLEPPANGFQRQDDVAAPTAPPSLPPFSAPAEFDDETEPQRAPTFPLPPRRPSAPPPQPDRRPPPERVARPIEPTMLDVPPQGPPSMPPQITPQLAPQAFPADAPPMAEPQPMPPQLAPSLPSPAEAAPPVPAPPRPMPPVLAPADRPVPTRPSPFLKPLPPRPPIRPLKRVTPQAAPGAPPPSAVAPASAAPEMGAERHPVDEPVDAQRKAPPVTPPPTAPEPVEPTSPKDGLESLEEEMAKLLGR